MTTTQLAASLMTASLFSKLLGFFRELFLANYYGTSYVIDAYSMGPSIPGTLLAGILGAISAAYMPMFSKKMALGNENDAHKFTSQLINVQTIITAVCSVAGWIFADQIVSWLAPGFEGEAKTLTIYFMRISFIVSVIGCIKGPLQTFLQYKGSFLMNVVLGYAQNAAIIGMIIVSGTLKMPRLLIYGTLMGNVILLIGNVIYSKKFGFKYFPSFSFGDSTKEILSLAVPVFLTSSASQLNAFFDKMLASKLAEGSVSALHYASLLVGVVTSLTFSIFLSILYPRIAKACAEKNMERVKDLSRRTLSLTYVLAIPFTIGSVVFAKEVVQVIFERGSFSEESTALTATAFIYYGIGMFFTGISSCVSNLFSSMHDTKTTAVFSLCAIVLNLILNFSLVGPMGHAGLALATTISGAFSTTCSYIAFRKKYKDIPLINDWKKFFLTVLFSLTAVFAARVFYDFIVNRIFIPRMIILGCAVVLAAIIYLILLIIFKYEELGLIDDLLNRRKKES